MAEITVTTFCITHRWMCTSVCLCGFASTGLCPATVFIDSDFGIASHFIKALLHAEIQRHECKKETVRIAASAHAWCGCTCLWSLELKEEKETFLATLCERSKCTKTLCNRGVRLFLCLRLYLYSVSPPTKPLQPLDHPPAPIFRALTHTHTHTYAVNNLLLIQYGWFFAGEADGTAGHTLETSASDLTWARIDRRD